MAEVLSTGSLYMVSTCHTLYGQEDSVQAGEVRYDSFDLASVNLLIMAPLLLLPIKQNCSYFTLPMENCMERVGLVASTCTQE